MKELTKTLERIQDDIATAEKLAEGITYDYLQRGIIARLKIMEMDIRVALPIARYVEECDKKRNEETKHLS